jgi:hypothetical protein
MSRRSQYVRSYLWQTTQGLKTSAFHLSQGRLVQFRGDTIVRTSVMRAIPSQEKLAIAKAAGAKLTAVGRDMHSTMVTSRTRLQFRENHQMTKKNSFRTNLLPTLDKRPSRHCTSGLSATQKLAAYFNRDFALT